MDARELFHKLTGRLGFKRERLINESIFLEHLNDTIETLAADTGFNIESLRGQTVAAQMAYDFPRLMAIHSLRVGVTWDSDTGECTDPGYELVDSTNARRLSIRTADRYVDKSQLGVT